MSTKRTPLKTTLFSIPVLLAILLIPRVSENGKISDKKIENETATVNIPYVDLNFPVLRITKEDIIQLFEQKTGEPTVHKVVFKFNIDDKPETLNPSLTAFRAKRNDRKYINPDNSKTLERTKMGCRLPGEYTLGNLELKRRTRDRDEDSWEKILEKWVDGDTYLYFYPTQKDQNGAKRIVYSLYWGGNAPPYDCEEWLKMLPPPSPDGGLNPSPPADPQ